MVDVVGNHVGPVGTDYSKITPFNRAEHYHDICQIVDWNNQWQVENCRLCDLPDLKQENEWVINKLCEWIHDIVQKYDFDGIRIDTIMEVPKWFWDKFTSAAGVFQIGEAFNGNPGYVAGYQGHVDSVFNYPLYYAIKDSFCGSMRNLENYWFNTRKYFPDPTILGVFVENHDNPRFLNMCGDRKKFKNASIFSLFFEGILYIIMEVNNTLLVELILIIEKYFGIIWILELICIKLLKLLIKQGKIIKFGRNLLFKDMLMMFFMLLLEEMF